MVSMRLGRPALRPAVLLAVVLAPALAGCGLFDGGSNAEEALEYLPADTFAVRFSDRAAMAERLGVDGVDPRDVSEGDVDDYTEALTDQARTAVASTRLTEYVSAMRDAPLNDFDVVWEAFATWGDADDRTGGATVWKVGDDVDFDALADDLVDKGFGEETVGDHAVFTADSSLVGPEGAIGATYPPFLLNVLLDEDEQIVATAVQAEALDDLAEVISDDADSLADDESMDHLLQVSDDDPELAWVTTDGAGVCPAQPLVPEGHHDQYADLGRPEARAFLVSGDEAEVVLALDYENGNDAEDDLEARQTLVDEGVDPTTADPFDELGDFTFERHGDLLVIDQDFDGGPLAAARAEQSGGGPGSCPAGTAD